MKQMNLSQIATNTQHKVFVYGTLLAEEILNVLLNRVPSSSSATLPGYHRFSITGRVYPAIKPVIGSQVVGKVFLDISDTELMIFDEFEDYEYDRDLVTVILGDETTELDCFAYIWHSKHDPKLNGDWNYEEWRNLHSEEYIKMCAAFKEELVLPAAKPPI